MEVFKPKASRVSQLVDICNTAVEARTRVDADAGVSLVEQYTTVDENLKAGHFDPKVFVNCLHISEECC